MVPLHFFQLRWELFSIYQPGLKKPEYRRSRAVCISVCTLGGMDLEEALQWGSSVQRPMQRLYKLQPCLLFLVDLMQCVTYNCTLSHN